MNIQSISQMERRVYKPSIEKLVELSDILNVTPNDILMKDYEYYQWKEERFSALNNSVTDIVDIMNTVEDLRAKAKLARERKDGNAERGYLDQIIGIFAWRNEHMAEIADYLYYKRLNEIVRKGSDELKENKIMNMKILKNRKENP
ncbi:helix-turn-helix transcriptional regulator [Bacillus sp. DX1.1]|uniref:helix-turn-helix domain-containing protein n=1 Tax=unclassified Bacillus (in: firmicutes) TaxID=185979 RepID=UPI002570DC55|nr:MULTISPECIES: helix-turn-helix transcriptional regulator [unclassified Bacillus (in: firmicutes)]MDM5154703.1 helix-turn-helix transcriptional regulator [Bacillus sp. DX1.1]WJE83591.1 helix-turn-helix transcriptional regulator [Bacillus sp. DX3.1]